MVQVKESTQVEEEDNGFQAQTAFLNNYAGTGTDSIGQNAVSLSYLTILQDVSDIVRSRQADPGVFFNTGTQKVLGTEVKVVPVAFKVVWDERDNGGKTVARYEPHSVDFVEEVNLHNRSFPVRVNPITRNKIIETFAYALILVDYPEAGYLMHTAGVGSMKVYRRWNTMLKQMRLPNGNQAPLFAKYWTLVTDSKISKTTNTPFYALSNVIEGDWVDRDLFAQTILPARESSMLLLLSAPTTTDDVETDD